MDRAVPAPVERLVFSEVANLRISCKVEDEIFLTAKTLNWSASKSPKGAKNVMLHYFVN